MLDEFHLPKRVYLAHALALANKKATAEIIATVNDGSIAIGQTEIARYHRLVQLKQMASRGNMRNSDENGICGHMNLMTTMDRQFLNTEHECVFPNAPEPEYIDYSGQPKKSKTNPTKVSEHITNAHKQGTTEIWVSEAAEINSMKPKEFSRAFNSSPKCKSHRREGWTYIAGSANAATKPRLILTSVLNI